jgi:hypothetical protein
VIDEITVDEIDRDSLPESVELDESHEEDQADQEENQQD